MIGLHITAMMVNRGVPLKTALQGSPAVDPHDMATEGHFVRQVASRPAYRSLEACWLTCLFPRSCVYAQACLRVRMRAQVCERARSAGARPA